MHNYRLLKLIVLGLGVSALTACVTVGPDYKKPNVEQTALVNLDNVLLIKRDEQWWKLFNDPMLNTIVEATLNNNHSLESANANVRAALAVYSNVETTNNLSGSFDASYNDGERLISGVIDQQTRIRFINTGANINIDLDLFGKLKRVREVAKADALATEFAWLDLRISLIAQSALRYSEYLNALMRREVTLSSIASLKQTRQVTSDRVQEGFSSQLDLSSIEATLYGLQATLPALDATAERARQALLILTGRSIDITISPDRDLNSSFPDLEHPIAIGNPQQLLRQRPDVHAAEQALIASTAQTGIATADLYPDVSISGFLGFITNDSLDFNRNTRAWAVAPTLQWNVFNLQALRTNVKVANAKQEASLADFKQRVLIALSEAEISLSDYKSTRLQQILLEKQFIASNQALDIALEQFDQGAIDALDLIDVRRTKLTAQDTLVQAKTNNFSAMINLYLAFGGGLLDTQLDQEIE